MVHGTGACFPVLTLVLLVLYYQLCISGFGGHTGGNFADRHCGPPLGARLATLSRLHSALGWQFLVRNRTRALLISRALVASEIGSGSLREKTMTLSTTTNVIVGWLMAFTMPWLLNAIGARTYHI